MPCPYHQHRRPPAKDRPKQPYRPREHYCLVAEWYGQEGTTCLAYLDGTGCEECPRYWRYRYECAIEENEYRSLLAMFASAVYNPATTPGITPRKRKAHARR